MQCTWPSWPEEPTPEDDKAESRKKNKVYIPIKAKAVFYAERQACGATRFHHNPKLTLEQTPTKNLKRSRSDDHA